jgi:hypothetical protein
MLRGGPLHIEGRLRMLSIDLMQELGRLPKEATG